jgi:S1-C subfamily serine protease
MNSFDYGILVVGALAALGGWRTGFLARVFSWCGLGAGLYVAVRYMATIVKFFNLSGSVARMVLAIAVLVVAAFVGEAVGLTVGSRLHSVLPFGGVRTADRAIGALLGVVGVLAALWLLAPSLAAVPGAISRLTTGSVIARWVSDHAPRPPKPLEALQRLVGEDGFPQVFKSLEGPQAVLSAPSAVPMAASVVATVSASTVRVEGQACGRSQEGSGWAVAPDLIVTNAHVVAGEPAGATSVLLPDGVVKPATVVLYDPNVDLALLSVPGLGEKPLPVGTGALRQVGAVFGHPRGQQALAVQPAAITEEVTAVGYDLYGTHETHRDVFVLAARLQPGDSGAPLVGTTGDVVGIAFAIAPDSPTTAYALTTKDLEPLLAQPHANAVPTGACLSD